MVITPSPKADGIKGSDAREHGLNGKDLARGEKATPAIKRVHVLEHAVARHALSALRNRETSAELFRYFSNQLMMLLAIEATRSVPLTSEEIETYGGPHSAETLAKPIIFLALARHSMGLTHHVAEIIPNVAVGAIGLEHSANRHRLEPRLHLLNAPALKDARVLIFDPVIASGVTVGAALNLLHRSGANDVSVLNFVMSAESLRRIQATLPDVFVWTGAIEAELDSKRGPLPGIGNFSERLYG